MKETYKTVAHAVLIYDTREIIQILELQTQPLIRQLATAEYCWEIIPLC